MGIFNLSSEDDDCYTVAMRWNRKKAASRFNQPEAVSFHDQPILESGVEKVELVDGQVDLLDSPRIAHSVEGRVITGYKVDPETGRTTGEIRRIDMRNVVRHTALGWRNIDRTFHELGVTPWSLTR